MGEYINPLDLKKIYIDYFLGNPNLFVFAFVIIVSFISAYNNMSNKTFGYIIVVSSLLFAAYLGQAYYFVILVILGFILFKAFAKIFV